MLGETQFGEGHVGLDFDDCRRRGDAVAHWAGPRLEDATDGRIVFERWRTSREMQCSQMDAVLKVDGLARSVEFKADFRALATRGECKPTKNLALEWWHVSWDGTEREPGALQQVQSQLWAHVCPYANATPDEPDWSDARCCIFSTEALSVFAASLAAQGARMVPTSSVRGGRKWKTYCLVPSIKKVLQNVPPRFDLELTDLPPTTPTRNPETALEDAYARQVRRGHQGSLFDFSEGI